MRHLRPGDVALGRDLGIVADHRDRAGGERSVDVAIAVGGLAFHGDEAPAGLHATGVVVEPGDLGIAALEEELRAVEELLELHYRRFNHRGH